MSTLFILYGSATGNAQQIAQDLAAKYTNNNAKLLPKPFTSVVCCEADQFKKKCSSIWENPPSSSTNSATAASKHGLIVVASTTGNGDAPENASRFVRYIKRRTTPDTKPFQHVSYAVLGLGDTNYDQFCATGKLVDRKLNECAGTRCMPLVCADEATGLEEDVDPWVDQVVDSLAKSCLNQKPMEEEGEKKDVDEKIGKIENEKKNVQPINFLGSRPNIPGIGSRPNIPGIPNIAGIGSRPNIAAVGSKAIVPTVESKPNISSNGSKPIIPAVGSKPNFPLDGSSHDIPSVGSKPTISSNDPKPIVTIPVGSKPNVSAILGSKPSVSSVGSVSSNVTSTVGSRPHVPTAYFGSRPSIPGIGSRPVVHPKKTESASEVPSTSSINTEKSASPLFILYGSATGNAQHIAQDLESKYKSLLNSSPDRCYFPSVVCHELDQYKRKCSSTWDTPLPTNSKKHGIIIITSTTGNGDAPENASRFVRYIKRRNTVDTMPFQYCAYAVLALGDTNYDQFCATGKLVDRKLGELGGMRAKSLGCADEGTGLEDVVDPWVESVFQELTRACRGSGGDNDEAKTDIEASTATRIVNDSGAVRKVEEEEKKAESVVDMKEDSLLSPSVERMTLAENEEFSSHNGVSMIKKIISNSSFSSQQVQQQMLAEVKIPSVAQKSLPSLGSSLSSCELVVDDDADSNSRRKSRGMSLAEMDRMTVSTNSSTAIYYNLAHPFESNILNARYLTKTDLSGAKLASEILTGKKVDANCAVDDDTEDEKLTQAMKRFEESFPLVPKSETDKLQCEQNSKRVIEMTMALPDDYTLEYQPGDSIGLIVFNTPEATSFISNMLQENHGIAPTQKIIVDGNRTITAAKAVRENIDLCSPLKNKRVLMSLSQFASDSEEEAALRLLSSKTPLGEELFEEYITKQRRNMVDVFQDFPSCQNINLDGLLAILPGIAPRYYSVSSSPLTNNGTDEPSLTVSFSVVDYMTTPVTIGNDIISRRVGGLATRYLEVLCAPFLSREGDTNSALLTSSFAVPTVKIFPKPTSEFHLPASITNPLILIGPGTGIAPFMGFLAHRKAQMTAMDATRAAKVASEGTWRGGYDIEEEELSITRRDASGLVIGADYRNSQNVGDIDVYFGCRYSNHDWLYEDEMKSLEKDGTISKLNISFSRDGKKKEYVQDKMRDDDLCVERLVRMVMDQNGMVYVCGDGNAMAKDVQAAFVEILAKKRFSEIDNGDDEVSRGKAKAYLEEMKTNSRFVMDIWS